MFRLTGLLVLSRGLSTSAPRLETFIDRVRLMGRVGADPKVYQIKDGADKLVTFRLCTNHVRKIVRPDGSFSEKEEAQWHNIVVLRKSLQSLVLEWVSKGSRVLLDGDVTYSGRRLDDGSTTDYRDIILRDLTYSSGRREEQSVTDSNDTGSNKDIEGSGSQTKESGM